MARMRAGQPATIVTGVLSNHTFRGYAANLAPVTGSRLNILPAENATESFTKVVQRMPVRVVLEGDGTKLDVPRSGLSVIVTVNEKSSRRVPFRRYPPRRVCRYRRRRRSSSSSTCTWGCLLPLLTSRSFPFRYGISATARRRVTMKPSGYKPTT